jgi:hypothetical protein
VVWEVSTSRSAAQNIFSAWLNYFSGADAKMQKNREAAIKFHKIELGLIQSYGT